MISRERSEQEFCNARAAKFLLFFAGLVLIACKLAYQLPVATATPGFFPTQTFPTSPTLTAITPPTSTSSSQPVFLPTATAPVTPLAASISRRNLRDELAALLGTGRWADLGLPVDLSEKWTAYAGGQVDLADSEQEQLRDFLDQLQQLDGLAGALLIPKDAGLAYRTSLAGSESELPRVVVYAVRAQNEPDQETESLFLVARGADGQGVGLVEAPAIPGLYQRIHASGYDVEYFDPGNQRVLLLADAYRLERGKPEDETLKARLEEIYPSGSDYVGESVYPRYFFPVEGIEAGFFTLEKSLTYNQILQLNEAFDLYNRPTLQPLKAAFFGKGISVVIVERLKLASGVTYTGTGVVELDRQELFGNKYYLAEVLAHEGAHVLQGPLKNTSQCSDLLRREVGNQTIPYGFYDWSAEELVEEVKAEVAGAYHVSLWMLTHLGIKGPEIQWLQDVIRTGTANGQSLLLDCR